MNRTMRAGSEGSENVDVSGLPYRRPLRTWAGRGTGATCNECAQPIGPDDIEYEIELPPGSDAPKVNLHFDCYKVWARRGIR